MERADKCSLIALSVVQIIVSAVFLTLGLVDGLKIRYGSASLLYKPCWLAALSLPVGIMGLVLARSRRPSPMLIKAIWSLSVPCIVFSALVVFSYYQFGIATLVLTKHARSGSFLSSRTDSGFLKEDTSLKYTEKEEEALAVFGIIVILSILEMILAAAIAKISDTSYQSPQSSPMYYMYSQPGQDGFSFPQGMRDVVVNQNHHGRGITNFAGPP